MLVLFKKTSNSEKDLRGDGLPESGAPPAPDQKDNDGASSEKILLVKELAKKAANQLIKFQAVMPKATTLYFAAFLRSPLKKKMYHALRLFVLPETVFCTLCFQQFRDTADLVPHQLYHADLTVA